jgi:hypothetical protein
MRLDDRRREWLTLLDAPLSRAVCWPIAAGRASPVLAILPTGALLSRWRITVKVVFASGMPVPGRAAQRSRRSGVVTVSECASHAMTDAEIGGIAGKGAGEQSLPRGLYARLAEDWLLIAVRNFYNWADRCTPTDCGASQMIKRSHPASSACGG